MRKLVLLMVVFQLLYQTFCNPRKVSNQHGFEEISSLVKLQRSNSIDTIKDYLSRFENWKMDRQDSLGYLWYYRPNDRNHVSEKDELSLWALKIGPNINLSLRVHNEKLLTRYLYQVSQDSAYILTNKFDANEVVSKTYKFHDSYIEIANMSKSDMMVVVYSGKNR